MTEPSYELVTDGSTDASYCGDRWHDTPPTQCPNCTSDRRDWRFVMPVLDTPTVETVTQPCPDPWHDPTAADTDDEPRECTCAMSEATMVNCAVHGYDAPEL